MLTCLRTNSTTFDLNSGGCAIFMFELQSNQYWIFISEACTASSIFIWAASSPTAWSTLFSAQCTHVDQKYLKYLLRIFFLDYKLQCTHNVHINQNIISYFATFSWSEKYFGPYACWYHDSFATNTYVWIFLGNHHRHPIQHHHTIPYHTEAEKMKNEKNAS